MITLLIRVMLGGTGKETGKRHPTIGDNVMISAGAKNRLSFLRSGKIPRSERKRGFGGSSPNCTVVGVPGRVVKRDNIKIPRSDMDQRHLPDPVSRGHYSLQRENAELVNRKVDLNAS